MEKNKEDEMTDLEIIKQEVDFLDKYMADHELDERFEAILTSATRMAAEIERLKKNVEFVYINETEKQFVETLSDNDKKELIENLLCANLTKALANEKLRNEKALLQIALAEKPDIVRCWECSNLVINDNAKYCGICLDAKRKRNDFCSYGTRKEAKDED